MEELIHLAVVERVMLGLAIGLPLVGAVVGLGWGARSGQARAGAAGTRAAGRGLIAGLIGPLIWLLWKVYNAIEDHYGLDSVKALLLNLALFIVVGTVAGILWGSAVSGQRSAISNRPSEKTDRADR